MKLIRNTLLSVLAIGALAGAFAQFAKADGPRPVCGSYPLPPCVRPSK